MDVRLPVAQVAGSQRTEEHDRAEAGSVVLGGFSVAVAEIFDSR